MAEKILSEDDEAPDFLLKDERDKEISLSDFRGKWVVLYFYPRDNTPGCTTEAMEFSDELKAFEKLNALVMGISRDSTASHLKFIEKKSLKIKLLSDPDHMIMEEYGVWQLKKMYGKESMGIVRSTFIIDPEGNIRRAWYKVKVNGHVKEVKEALTALQKG